VLIPALAACVVATAAVGVSHRLSPDATQQTLALMRAQFGEYVARLRLADTGRSEQAAVVVPPVPAQAATPATEPAPAAAEPMKVEDSLPQGPALQAAAKEVQKSAELIADAPAPPQAAVQPPPEAATALNAASLSPALIKTLLRRGNEMLALRDFASARLLFARAAQTGDVAAMLALGRTYDPASFDPRGARPILDRKVASHWYGLAAAAGNAEAADLLHQIERRVAK
jgi:TPR repeat protein